jgi:hypothetical protein
LKLKEQIVNLLKWALSKFEDKTPQIEAWPFPVPAKKKPTVKKATTRTTKKPAVAAKTARTKKAK